MITPIIREFFKGLRERDELDVIVPDLLTGMGLEVVSRPTRGPRQYGADVIAVGSDTDGTRKLFVFSIKRGDLTRQEWSGSDQAVRQSLEEIKDVVLNERAPEHRGLPAVICVVIGGIVPENMQRQVNGYLASNTTDSLTYTLWTGDTLTSKVLEGALREDLFNGELRSLLRKAAAIVEQPDIAMSYFTTLVDKVAAATEEPVTRVRILYLAVWILYVWGRDAGDLEAPYEASELVALRAWELLWKEIDTDNSRTQEASHTFFDLVQLHLQIWDALYGEKVLPRAGELHALSFAVGSVEAVDINLAMFKTIGRIATGGLWRLWLESAEGDAPRLSIKEGGTAEHIALGLGHMPGTNPTLLSPFCDDQGVDLALALLLLSAVPSTQDRARIWARGTAHRFIADYNHHNRYPTIDGSYTNLLRHPAAQTDEYRREATTGSIIMPLLAMVAWAMKDDGLVTKIAMFQRDEMAHSNFQTWVPNSRTEAGIWKSMRRQGSSLGHLTIGDTGDDLIRKLREEAEANSDYPALSAIRLHHWPMLLLACRHNRLPVPPQIWMQLLEQLRATPLGGPSAEDSGKPPYEESSETDETASSSV